MRHRSESLEITPFKRAVGLCLMFGPDPCLEDMIVLITAALVEPRCIDNQHLIREFLVCHRNVSLLAVSEPSVIGHS